MIYFAFFAKNVTHKATLSLVDESRSRKGLQQMLCFSILCFTWVKRDYNSQINPHSELRYILWDHARGVWAHDLQYFCDPVYSRRFQFMLEFAAL
jgi:hypothetical protein